MSAGWIQIDALTPDKPEIYLISEILNIEPDAVLGKLVRLWIWADLHTINGNTSCITCRLVDRIVFMPGFAEALIQVGWLKENHCCLSLTDFKRHNPLSSKARALREKKQRSAIYSSSGDTTLEDVPHQKSQALCISG